MPARPAGCRLLGRLAAAMQTEQTASGIEEMEHRVDEAAQFARGLHEALLPAVSECDQSMRGVAISQRVLNTQLDKLSEGTPLVLLANTWVTRLCVSVAG